jgi:hypothetical protein
MPEIIVEDSSETCPELLEAGNIDLYCRNAFRITGLAVNASQKTIAKHAERLKLMEELGRGQIANTPSFNLNPSPSVDRIREAIQRLKDPGLRIIDEFFWFWSEGYAEGREDAAIQAILQGASEQAYELWAQREDDPGAGHVASHNIAVMFQMIALDWTRYQLAEEIGEEVQGKIRAYWHESLSRWKRIISDERIWDAVGARIRFLADARLGTGLEQRLKGSLPLTLAKINAEAAFRFAEQGSVDLARVHLGLIRDSIPQSGIATKAIDRVLSPIIERIRQYIKTAAEQSGADPKNANQAVQRLIENSAPLLPVFELFYGRQAYQTAELFDDVAATSLNCLLSFKAETGDNATFRNILETSIPFAAGPEVLQLIEQNLRWSALEPLFTRLRTIQDSTEPPRVRFERINSELMPELILLAEQHSDDPGYLTEFSNALAITLRGLSVDAYNNAQDFQSAVYAIRIASKLAYDPEIRKRIEEDQKVAEETWKDSACNFCGSDASTVSSHCQIPMYGDVQRSWGKVHYRHTKVAVPRCDRCKGFHGQQRLLWWAIVGVCVACGVYVASLFEIDRTAFALAIGGLVGIIFASWIGSIRASAKGRLPYGDYRRHPRIKTLRNQGWYFGYKPSR